MNSLHSIKHSLSFYRCLIAAKLQKTLIFFLCLSNASITYAQIFSSQNDWHQEHFFGISGHNEVEGSRKGGELSVTVLGDDNLSYRYGFTFEDSSQVPGTSNFHPGLSFSVLGHFKQKIITPYIGFGAFLELGSEYTQCSEDENSASENRQCYNERLFALYPEIGMFTTIGSVYLGVFGRRYLSNLQLQRSSQSSAYNSIGVNFSFRFEPVFW